MTNCDGCSKKNLWRNTGRRNERGAVIRQCTNCGHYQAEPTPQGLKLPKRLLYYDIETSKMSVETFDLYVPNKRLNWKNIKQPSFLICWSACWITNETKPEDKLQILSDALTPWEARRGWDKRCLTGLWELMNKADYICGHNIKAFDTKKAHWYFLMDKMLSPDLTVKQVDTLVLMKKHFKGESNALEYLRLRMGGRPKKEMESEDWDRCKLGDPKALNKMRTYNKGDVREGVGLLLDVKRYIESGGGVLIK